jgi:hypothetical protein
MNIDGFGEQTTAARHFPFRAIFKGRGEKRERELACRSLPTLPL